MKNIYEPQEISHILAATIGTVKDLQVLTGHEREEMLEDRAQFITAVGKAVAAEVLELRGDTLRPVVVFAGDSINGAYALETAAALHAAGCTAEVYLINIGGNLLSEDTRRARDRFVADTSADFLFETVDLNLLMPELEEDMIVVDGIFGREYGSSLRGGYQVMARRINESDCTVVSIDVPSGMNNDLSVGMINRNIVHADLTLTLVGPTLSFYMPENAELVGKWKTLAVPLNRAAVRDCNCRSRLTDAWGVRSLLPVRDEFVSKADLGTALLFAGSYGMLGAAVLCGRSALRSGCGKVVIHGPRCAFYTLQTAVPGAMFETDGADMEIRRFESEVEFEAVAVGPGIGTSEVTIDGLETFLKAMYSARLPVILDADALNCISRRKSLLDHIPPRSVLTPHAGEFDRIFGRQPSASARLLRAQQAARMYQCIIVLKGHYTQIIWPDGSVVVNNSGTDALATAGSGDVLTGLIAGLTAQSLAPELAAVAGVYVHGVAGSIAAETHGARGTTAEDIAAAVGQALRRVLETPQPQTKNKRKTKDL